MSERDRAGERCGRLAIMLAPGGDKQAAERLAQRTQASLLPADADLDAAAVVPASFDIAVRFDALGTCLLGDGMVLRPDLSAMAPRLKPGRLNRELLVRAAKVKRPADAPADARLPLAVDATAGLGEDALLLAAAGFSVLLFESDPVIAELLRDSLRRAAAAPEPELRAAASRMRVAGEDSIAALPGLAPAPDVVYLDPMFPERRKSAAVKKKFQLIHRLERPCDDEDALVAAALAARPRKVVIKRPVKGPHLAGIKPSYSIAGKSVRYDVLAR